MKKTFFLTLILLIPALLSLPAVAGTTEVDAVEVKVNSREILVSVSLKPDHQIIEDINAGISKELVFYIDLFRVWNIWPDEFVTGRKIMKVLSCDPIKREYSAENREGSTHTIMRFRDIDTMISWATELRNIRLTDTRELEPGTYFVKITAESLIRKLPPVIGYLLFFVPEKDFTVTKDSPRFLIGPSRNSR